ncbi:MAG: PTS sugar transporter subunit IIB [Myxococcales bacterium]|nr:PTS sugar transporter subunit IIB [Myxococcales bacterium]MCB9530964.1 PTS sugar transporter subunit IIB [Myxococcales bacterium]MCB9532884.1 PTS sugar transporter subunit IIB [Myxococcales bacterium]
MTPRLHLDDRGINRTLVDHWLPHLDIDVVWLVGRADVDDELQRDIVPVVPISPFELPSIVAEPADPPTNILALFGSPADLAIAADLGLAPARVVIHHIGASSVADRICAEVFVDDDQRATLADLERRGFSFEIHPLPVVTARPWSPSVEPGDAKR